MKLLYRGLKKSDEFFGDYISRISVKNGYANKEKFRKSLGEYYLNNCEENYGYLNENAMLRLALEHIVQRNIPVDEHHKFNSSRRDMWIKDHRICDDCWHQEAYIRFYWWFTDYQRCHVHKKSMRSKGCSRSKDTESLGAECNTSLTEKIVQRYSGDEKAQVLVIREIEWMLYDIPMAQGMQKILKNEVPDSLRENTLEMEIRSGAFIGLPPNLRISRIADFYSTIYGNHDFWLRILALMICTPRNLGLYCASGWRNLEHLHYCRSILGYDPFIREVLLKVSRYKEYSSRNKISMTMLKKSLPEMSNEFFRKFRTSLFLCRFTESDPVDKQYDVWNKTMHSQYEVRES